MINYHKPADWNYEVVGKRYIKVGPYGMDDVEYEILSDGSIYLVQEGIYHNCTLQEVYTQLNEEWMREDEGI